MVKILNFKNITIPYRKVNSFLTGMAEGVYRVHACKKPDNLVLIFWNYSQKSLLECERFSTEELKVGKKKSVCFYALWFAQHKQKYNDSIIQLII